MRKESKMKRRDAAERIRRQIDTPPKTGKEPYTNLSGIAGIKLGIEHFFDKGGGLEKAMRSFFDSCR